VYASHVIEHLDDPITAVINWMRICKPGGVVIIYAPHRDLYEGRRILPSQWNADHRYFLLPNTNEPPCTFSLRGIIDEACARNPIRGPYWKFSCLTRDEGWSKEPGQHASGEYSIEAIIFKPAQQ